MAHETGSHRQEGPTYDIGKWVVYIGTSQSIAACIGMRAAHHACSTANRHTAVPQLHLHSYYWLGVVPPQHCLHSAGPSLHVAVALELIVWKYRHPLRGAW